jgi:SulP family sulfate permease
MSNYHEFIPKSFQYLKNYSFDLFRRDLFSGVTVGIIALPLAMAFAIASGVGPERGLYTAIIAGFLISAFGGSRVQIGGPTGAFVVIIYGIIQRTGYSGLCVSTLIASVLLVLFGLLRLGSWIRYVPRPLIVGFTAGIAVLIFSSQVKDFLGLQMGAPPAQFIQKWSAYAAALPTAAPTTFAVGVGSLALILLLRRFAPRFPWGIASIVAATAIGWMLHLPVDTIASRFGEIPHTLPIPSIPSFSIPVGHWPAILLDAVTIAFLAGIESLLSAVVADGMMGGRHRSNCELIAQGIGNFGSILFGGIPATGAIARTAANVKTGAKTPVSGMIHAITLLLVMACLAPIVSLIPLAALAAVLFMVAWNMSEMGHFIHLAKGPLADRMILLTSFFLTVFADLTLAIGFGMVLACFLFMKQMSALSRTIRHQESDQKVEVHEIQGPLFFGAADLLKDLLLDPTPPPKVMILRMDTVSLIDASGLHALEEFFKQCKKSGTILLLSGVQNQAGEGLLKFGIADLIGRENLLPNIDAALARAREI